MLWKLEMALAMKGLIMACVGEYTFTQAMEGAACYGSFCVALAMKWVLLSLGLEDILPCMLWPVPHAMEAFKWLQP